MGLFAVLLQNFLFAMPEIKVVAPSAAALVSLAIAMLLLLVSGFVSGSEIAFFSLTQTELEKCSESDSPTDKYIL